MDGMVQIQILLYSTSVQLPPVDATHFSPDVVSV